MKPWHRLKAESEPAYAAFLVYRDLARTHRTLEAVADVLRAQSGAASGGRREGVKKPGGTIYRWSSRFRWVERAQAWDDHVRARVDAVRIREYERWERRRVRQLEAVYDDAERLRSKGRKLLELPHVRVERCDGDGRPIALEAAPSSVFLNASVLLMRAAELATAALNAIGQDPPDGYTPDVFKILDVDPEGDLPCDT